MIYLAIDPPQGWANYNLHTKQFKFGVLPFLNDTISIGAYLILQELIENADTVVYENFRLRPDLAKAQTGSEFFTVKVIGLIELIKTKHQHKTWVKQEPSFQMAQATLQHLRMWNLPCENLAIPSTLLSHPRSALAHLATWVTKNDKATYAQWEQMALEREDLSCVKIRNRLKVSNPMEKVGKD